MLDLDVLGCFYFSSKTDKVQASAWKVDASKLEVRSETQEAEAPRRIRRSESRKFRASNPGNYEKRFRATSGEHFRSHQHINATRPGEMRTTIASKLLASGETVPQSSWIKIENIPPLSSLDAILRGVQTVLDLERARGILDLEGEWNSTQSYESLPFLALESNEDWVKEARVMLSPFARPKGWKVRLANRSIVYALLTSAKESGLYCGAKLVKVSELKESEILSLEEYPQLSEATVRVENLTEGSTALTVLNLFSRFDLRLDGPSVVQWVGQTSDGKIPPTTWLVYFADAAWARAAVREKQGTRVDKRTVALAQYPRQLFSPAR